MAYYMYTCKSPTAFLGHLTDVTSWPSNILSNIKGILCDFFILTFGDSIVLHKYCTYNKPITKLSHVKTLQNLCNKDTKNDKKVRKCNSLFFKRRLWSSLELGSLGNLEDCLVSWLEMHFCKQISIFGRKPPDRGRASLTIS